MANFPLTEKEFVDTNDIAKVDYLPASTTDFATELLAEENAGDVVNPASPSQLTELLKSGRRDRADMQRGGRRMGFLGRDLVDRREGGVDGHRRHSAPTQGRGSV